MAWTRKAGAPTTFNLVDAFAALITGDPTWGWILDWFPYISNDHFNTDDFCAFGPVSPPDLSVALSPSPPDRNPLVTAGKIAAAAFGLTLAAHDRVFSAYCERAVAAGEWSTPICYAVPGDPANAGGQSGHVTLQIAPAGTTRVRVDAHAMTAVTITDSQLQIGADTVGPWIYSHDMNYINNGIPSPQEAAVSGGAEIYASGFMNGGGSVQACVSFQGAGFETHAATPQPLPTGVLSPIRTVDPSLEGIAAELARHEFKLDTLMTLLQSVAGATIDLGGDLADPSDVIADTPIPVLDAVGCVITASGVPASLSLDFGTPQRIVRLGLVNMGTAAAWYPSVALTHSPFVLRPFPPGVTRVTVTDLPPGVTCTIAFIQRNK